MCTSVFTATTMQCSVYKCTFRSQRKAFIVRAAYNVAVAAVVKHTSRMSSLRGASEGDATLLLPIIFLNNPRTSASENSLPFPLFAGRVRVGGGGLHGIGCVRPRVLRLQVTVPCVFTEWTQVVEPSERIDAKWVKITVAGTPVRRP